MPDFTPSPDNGPGGDLLALTKTVSVPASNHAAVSLADAHVDQRDGDSITNDGIRPAFKAGVYALSVQAEPIGEGAPVLVTVSATDGESATWSIASGAPGAFAEASGIWRFPEGDDLSVIVNHNGSSARDIRVRVFAIRLA